MKSNFRAPKTRGRYRRGHKSHKQLENPQITFEQQTKCKTIVNKYQNYRKMLLLVLSDGFRVGNTHSDFLILTDGTCYGSTRAVVMVRFRHLPFFRRLLCSLEQLKDCFRVFQAFNWAKIAREKRERSWVLSRLLSFIHEGAST